MLSAALGLARSGLRGKRVDGLFLLGEVVCPLGRGCISYDYLVPSSKVRSFLLSQALWEL